MARLVPKGLETRKRIMEPPWTCSRPKPTGVVGVVVEDIAETAGTTKGTV